MGVKLLTATYPKPAEPNPNSITLFLRPTLLLLFPIYVYFLQLVPSFQIFKPFDQCSISRIYDTSALCPTPIPP